MSLSFWNEEKAPFDFRVLAWTSIARPRGQFLSEEELFRELPFLRAKAISITLDPNLNENDPALFNALKKNGHIQSIDFYFPYGVTYDHAQLVYSLFTSIYIMRAAFHVASNDAELISALAFSLNVNRAPRILALEYDKLPTDQLRLLHVLRNNSTVRTLIMPKNLDFNHNYLTSLFETNKTIKELHLDIA